MGDRPITPGRGDLAQKARDIAARLPFSRESRELQEKQRAEHESRHSVPDTLYVVLHAYPGHVVADVVSGWAPGCEAFKAEGRDEPEVLRRLHGAYLTALEQGRVASGEAARARARRCKVEVLDRQVHAPELPKIIVG